MFKNLPLKCNLYLFYFFLLSIAVCLSGCVLTNYNMEENLAVKPYEQTKDSNKKSNEEENAKKLAQEEAPVEEKQTPINIDPQAAFDEALQFCGASQDFWQKGETEQALLSLDKAYSLILSIDLANFPDFSREKEELRFLISKRIVEIYTSRINSASGNGKTIPISMNEYVEKEIRFYMGRKSKKHFIEAYKRAGIYRPFILKTLKEAGLPEELSWLPLVESMFKVKALSKARALGLWQFIASTGYNYGLKRDRYIDERLDPIKSTNAAINYLKELHNIFGDWTTALAAYNSGEGRVLRIIKTQNENYLDNFWDLYEKLPRETAQYVPRFMAVIHIVNNLEKYGLENIEAYPPLDYENININKQMHLNDIAKAINIPYKTLKNLNPELRYSITPAGEYALKVPLQKSDILIANIDKIPSTYLRRTSYIYHKIKNGETLSTIARKYKTSMKSIAKANNIKRYGRIRAGKKIKIPKTTITAYRDEKIKTSSLFKPFNHTVEMGDSLWIIAKRYRTSIDSLKRLNGLNSSHIHPGQVLKIRKVDDAKNTAAKKLYTVKYGDTPFDIASDYNISLAKFLSINSLSPDSTIYPGQKLYVE
jgi:membrane-bound lytic murein transglycosylase D